MYYIEILMQNIYYNHGRIKKIILQDWRILYCVEINSS